MRKKILFTSVCFVLLSLPLVTQATTFDVRTGYKSASHKFESRFKVSQSWINGWALSLETDNNQGSDSWEQTTVSSNQIEASYSFKINDKLTLKPGSVYQWNSSGVQLKPYIRLSYKITPEISTGMRYRFDWNQYDSVDIYGKENQAKVNRIDLYLSYTLNPKWKVDWTGTAYRYINDFRYKNNKQWATENSFKVTYRYTPTISPYVEYDYLDKQGAYNGENNLNENRYRFGISFDL